MKVCRRCKKEKAIDCFQKVHHTLKSKDGLKSRCIDCINEVSLIAYNKKRLNPEFMQKERDRKMKNRHKWSTGEKTKHEYNQLYYQNYPEKKFCRDIMRQIKGEEGIQRHHWSYNKEHSTDIIPLTVIEHAKLHRYIIYDQEFYMYRRIDSMELLDTKEKHIEYYELIKHNK